jgi:hypothetical protein
MGCGQLKASRIGSPLPSLKMITRSPNNEAWSTSGLLLPLPSGGPASPLAAIVAGISKRTARKGTSHFALCFITCLQDDCVTICRRERVIGGGSDMPPRSSMHCPTSFQHDPRVSCPRDRSDEHPTAGSLTVFRGTRNAWLTLSGPTANGVPVLAKGRLRTDVLERWDESQRNSRIQHHPGDELPRPKPDGEQERRPGLCHRCRLGPANVPELSDRVLIPGCPYQKPNPVRPTVARRVPLLPALLLFSCY